MATKTKRLLVIANYKALLTVLSDFQIQHAPDLVFRTAGTVDEALGLLAVDAADTIVLGLIRGEDNKDLEARSAKLAEACSTAEIAWFNPLAIETKDDILSFFRTYALGGSHALSLLSAK